MLFKMYTIIRLILHVLYLPKKLEGNPICGIYKLFSQMKTKTKRGKFIQNQGALKLKDFLFCFGFL